MNTLHTLSVNSLLKKYFNTLKVLILLVAALSAGYFLGSYVQKTNIRILLKASELSVRILTSLHLLIH